MRLGKRFGKRVRFDKSGTLGDALQRLIESFCLRRRWLDVPQSIFICKFKSIQYRLK